MFSNQPLNQGETAQLRDATTILNKFSGLLDSLPFLVLSPTIPVERVRDCSLYPLSI